MLDKWRNKYHLTDEEIAFLNRHNPFDLAAKLLEEADPEGPAHQMHRRHVELSVKATTGGIIALAEYQVKRERQERIGAALSAIPLLRRFVKRGN